MMKRKVLSLLLSSALVFTAAMSLPANVAFAEQIDVGTDSPVIDNDDEDDGTDSPEIDNDDENEGVDSPEIDNDDENEGVDSPEIDNDDEDDGADSPEIDKDDKEDDEDDGVDSPEIDNDDKDDPENPGEDDEDDKDDPENPGEDDEDDPENPGEDDEDDKDDVTVGTKPEVVEDDEVVKAEDAKETIMDEIKNNNKTEISTVIDAPITVNKELLEEVKESNKALTISIVNEKNEVLYSWTFDSKNMDFNKMKDIDLSIQFETAKQAAIELLTGKHEAFYMEFKYHGELPGATEVKTYVGNQYKDGTSLYLYYYNEEKGQIEAVHGKNALKVKDGYVPFTLTHCSVYFLSENTPDVYGIDVEDDNTQPPAPVDPDVDTGDNSNVVFWSMLLVAGAAIVAFNRKNLIKR